MTQTIRFIEASYENAHHPLYESRSKEFVAVREYCKAYSYDITEDEFDMAIANRFSDGEYEWRKV